MTESLRVLHLEDHPRDAQIVRDRLEAEGLRCSIVLVSQRASYEAALAREPFDVILSDYNLPDYDGIAALTHALATQPGVPVILISGTMDEQEAVHCLRVGATDYLLKAHLERLVPAVHRAIEEAQRSRAQKAVEVALVESESRKAAILDSVLDSIVTMDADGTVIEFNAAASRTFGYSKAEAIGRPLADLMVPATFRERHRAGLAHFVATGEGPLIGRLLEITAMRSDGSELPVELAITAIGSGATSIFTGVLRDITARKQAEAERRALEEQYQQAQKMDAIGRLAAGVAHDFNNLLTVILGFCELLLADFDPADARQADIAEIQKAGTRAAGLTRQLLAFSRKEIIEPTLLDLNLIVTGIRVMLERLIGEDVMVVLGLGRSLALVKADRGQVEQIILNLAVNARDAMLTGGTLTIETANVHLAGSVANARWAVKSGPYVALTVTDTGTGMTPDVQARLFEPFFTTKGVGKGTGLGLATVHSIVTRSDGSLRVDSEVGRGTSFTVYLPQANAAEVSMAVAPPAARPRATGQTVLVVEDAQGLGELIKRLLERQGYTVLMAASADEALQRFGEHPSVDLLLTDVVMPGTSGPDLVRQLTARRPALKVIYMSGYTDDAIVHHGVLEPGIAFLQKPFSSEALGLKLREVLDR